MHSSSADPSSADLHRHFGLLQATALNVTMIVGAGVFITIPLMLGALPGPYAMLGWLVAGGLMLMDGLIWSELGATLPGSGGSFLYLLECFGRERWGRLMGFLFVWQFLISGPLEVATALIAIAIFARGLHPTFATFDSEWSRTFFFWPQANLGVTFGPGRLLGLSIGVLILLLLYRRITTLGRLTVTFWLGVLGAIAWILVEGFSRFDAAVAFDFSGPASSWPPHFATGLGSTMILAMYSYLGYYNVCYIGDEVRDPGKTIPRSILLSALIVCVLFIAVHLAMLGTVPWPSIPTKEPEVDEFSLPAEFMRRLYGKESWAPTMVTLLLIWSCFGSAFAALLGYSRIPYGAARYGHFFSILARVHPAHRIPHISLLLVCGLTLFWSFFDLKKVIDALLITRILEQFIGQIVGVIWLRRTQPQRPRPYRIWLYPLPCLLALAGWLYMYFSADSLFILMGLVTLIAGACVYVLWARRTGQWPFLATPTGD